MNQKEQHMDRILRIFEQCPGATITALAQRSGLARNTVKRLLEEMEKGHILEGIRLVTNEKGLTGREGIFMEIKVREGKEAALKKQAALDGMFRMITLAEKPGWFLLEGKSRETPEKLQEKYETLGLAEQVRLLRAERECLLERICEPAERG